MKVLEAIKERKSIRAFLDKPVDRNTIEEILNYAIWAPSWGNTQPWEFAVVNGELVKKIADMNEERFRAGEKPNPDLEMPEKWPEVYRSRYITVGKALFTTMGIKRGDREAREKHYINMQRFYGAPCVIFVYIDGALVPHYATLDVGAVTQNICLAALEYGLGTCIMAAAVHYPDIIREVTGLPKTKKLVLGIAIGYPDPDAVANKFRSSRASVEKVTSWFGF